MSNKAKVIMSICLVVIIVSLFLNWYLLHNSGDRGTFGDMFGVANALFSGLAFGGIIFTIYLQREDLKSTRVELKEAREEFRIQQFEANNKHITSFIIPISFVSSNR